MIQLSNRRSPWIAAFLCLLLTGISPAQESPPSTDATALADQKWYRVELLVFSQFARGSTEQWQPTPVLGYPPAARFLIDPLRVANNLAQYEATSVVDEFGRQILTLNPEPIEPILETMEPLFEPDTAEPEGAVPRTELEPGTDWSELVI
ncbi:MAG: hypothetical protein HOC23_11470, partial [Halieaceae bacterium]|nr:hypothetical protein [Halieaceae bacterium]